MAFILTGFDAPTEVQPGQQFGITVGVANTADTVFPWDDNVCYTDSGALGHRANLYLEYGGDAVDAYTAMCVRGGGESEGVEKTLTMNAPTSGDTFTATVRLTNNDGDTKDTQDVTIGLTEDAPGPGDCGEGMVWDAEQNACVSEGGGGGGGGGDGLLSNLDRLEQLLMLFLFAIIVSEFADITGD